MDISIDIDNYRLNVRAGAIIEINGKYLMCKSSGGHYFIVGGRVKVGETSLHTIKRELNEELRLVLDQSIKSQLESELAIDHNFHFLTPEELRAAYVLPEINKDILLAGDEAMAHYVADYINK